MPQDIIIAPFSRPPQSKPRALAQPTDLFKNPPKVIDVNGIGSDQFMGPGDTAPAPKEVWGGKPFSREAAMYRDSDGSVLRRLIQSKARGADVGRVALIAFSAGGTFAEAVLASEIDRKMIDVVILLDACHVAKNNNVFVPQALAPYAAFGAQALFAGVKADTGTASTDPFLGPVFISCHTNIKQSATLEAMVGNTTDSTSAVFNASAQLLSTLPEYQAMGGSPRHIETDFSQLVYGVPPSAFPITIGTDANDPSVWVKGVPGPAKTWKSMPMPLIKQAWGNFYDFDYGGTVAADHVFQAWHVQRAMWATFLAPRWNSDVKSPYNVSGLGDFSRCCPGAGGNFVPSGVYPVGGSLAWAALGAAFGFVAGKMLMEE